MQHGNYTYYCLCCRWVYRIGKGCGKSACFCGSCGSYYLAIQDSVEDTYYCGYNYFYCEQGIGLSFWSLCDDRFALPDSGFLKFGIYRKLWQMTKICLGFLVFCGEFVVSVRQPRKQGRRGRKHRSFPQGKSLFVLRSKAPQDKFMAALRWFIPRESNCIIEKAMKLKIFAILCLIQIFLISRLRTN